MRKGTRSTTSCMPNISTFTQTEGVNSWYFGSISYWVSAGRSVSNLCIFLFALHKTKGIRRLYASSRRVKQRFICSSLCRKKITRGGSHFPIKYSSAVGRSRLFNLPNWWLGGINSPLHYINKPMQLLYCQDKYSGTCLIRHTKGPVKCVGLYMMSE